MKTKTEIDFPKGYLYVEDKVSMMQRIQNMQLTAQQNHFDASSYSGPDLQGLMKALSDSCIKELKGLDAILFEGEGGI